MVEEIEGALVETPWGIELKADGWAQAAPAPFSPAVKAARFAGLRRHLCAWERNRSCCGAAPILAQASGCLRVQLADSFSANCKVPVVALASDRSGSANSLYRVSSIIVGALSPAQASDLPCSFRQSDEELRLLSKVCCGNSLPIPTDEMERERGLDHSRIESS